MNLVYLQKQINYYKSIFIVHLFRDTHLISRFTNPT